MKKFISLGSWCHPAMNLKYLGLRNESFPFDWILTKDEKVFYYVNDLINTNFKHFITNLTYNENKHVISKNYDFTDFRHHDLIKNISIGRDRNEKNLKEMYIRRVKRFMNNISDKNNNIIFLCIIHHRYLYNKDLWNDMKKFDNNINIKCSYKVLVYVYEDNNDFKFEIPKELSGLKHFIFDKYIRNQKICRIYGNKNDFKKLLTKNKLI